MSVGPVTANATLVVPEGTAQAEVDSVPVTAQAAATAQAATAQQVADTFTASNPDLSIPDLGQIHEPTAGAYRDLAAAKADLRQARQEPAGTHGRRADIRQARHEVRQAKAALNAETSGAGSALLKDSFTAGGVMGKAVAGLQTADGLKPAVANDNGHVLGNDLPFISQLHPAGNDGHYANADMNCAPAALAMIAKAHPDHTLDGHPIGQFPDAALINRIGQHADTNEQGTSPNGIIAAAEDMGFRATAHEGGYDANFIDGALAQGGSVIANGAYFIGDQLAGHFVTVAAKNADGTYQVNDPLQGPVTWTADELNRFLLSNPHNGGVTLGIF